jgi:TonB C terminal
MRPIFFAIIATLLVGCAGSQTHTHQAASPFSLYEDAFQNSIKRNWQALLHGKNRTGEIVLEFRLTSDGQITDMKVVKDSVGNGQSLICEKAVLASVPYPSWPKDMIRMVGQNYRVCTFTFNY